MDAHGHPWPSSLGATAHYRAGAGLADDAVPIRDVLVVFAPKYFVDDPVGPWFQRSSAAIIADTDRNRGPAMDVASIAPLTKRNVFKVLDDLPFAARVATDRLFLGVHSSVP
jgi:hypothetical protein